MRSGSKQSSAAEHSAGPLDGWIIPDRQGVPQFGLLSLSPEEAKRRRLVFGVTPLLEAVAVALILWALMTLPPSPVLKMAKQQVIYFHLATPPPPAKQPPRILQPPTEALSKPPVIPKLQQTQVQKPLVAHLQAPKITTPAIRLPKAPPAPKVVHLQSFAAAKLNVPPRPQVAPVRTGAFNPGSMAKATTRAPLRKVQTGGFGAANGIPAESGANNHTQVARLGSFDMPAGPGHGNGTGGAQGIRGTVGSSGFGNATGSPSGGGSSHAAPGSVQQSGFGNATAGTGMPHAPAAAQASRLKPVIILSKPDPVYPAEARQLHIEGEVIVEVVFEASGQVRVLRVVQGLGHGMDEAAVRAAEQIRFKPAERNGRPVDSDAMVHIIFQLAY